jgi:hypothetical protein
MNVVLPVFTPDGFINLYHLNELYGAVARTVSGKIGSALATPIPITSGIWGGTYLIAHPDGKAKRKIWRLYCIVNLPQNTPLDQRDNLERLIEFYYQTLAEAFSPYGLRLDIKMWGGRLPFSNKQKPSITMHMEDSARRVHWLRVFFTWNSVTWEESLIYDLARIIQEYKPHFDIEREPNPQVPKATKFILQDIIIMYHSLRNACSEEFVAFADPIIREMTGHFMAGLYDPGRILDLYMKVYEGGLIYGYEQALEEPYARAGLDVRDIENWPVEKINWVPPELKDKLIPPIRDLFAGFKAQLLA